jgi:hypothetical protein
MASAGDDRICAECLRLCLCLCLCQDIMNEPAEDTV